METTCHHRPFTKRSRGLSKEPTWNEDITLYIKQPHTKKLQIAAWDVNLETPHKRMGNAGISLEEVCDGSFQTYPACEKTGCRSSGHAYFRTYCINCFREGRTDGIRTSSSCHRRCRRDWAICNPGLHKKRLEITQCPYTCQRTKSIVSKPFYDIKLVEGEIV